MKIDPSKNHAVDKKESKNVFKTERSVFETVSKPSKTPTVGAFEKILEENRRDNRRAQPGTKTESSVYEAIGASDETDDPSELKADEKRHEQDGDSAGGDSGDSSPNPGFGNSTAHAPAQSSKAPPARTILHVADLERIVAMIRTENFKTHKQVTIALRNSVLKGLEIKLTLEENGRVKAEFLTKDATVRQKLNDRRRELATILSDRAPLFSELSITQE